MVLRDPDLLLEMWSPQTILHLRLAADDQHKDDKISHLLVILSRIYDTWFGIGIVMLLVGFCRMVIIHSKICSIMPLYVSQYIHISYIMYSNYMHIWYFMISLLVCKYILLPLHIVTLHLIWCFPIGFRLMAASSASACAGASCWSTSWESMLCCSECTSHCGRSILPVSWQRFLNFCTVVLPFKPSPDMAPVDWKDLREIWG